MGREPRTAGRNVVMTFGSGLGEIVVGAHYDAVRLPDGSLSRGAVDNAASSVMLVRMAEALKADPLPGRVRIVWFDMEELGLLGSAEYVRKHAADTITAMVNFDVNAYGKTIVFGPSDRKENAVLRRALLEVCASEDVPCVGFPQMPPGDDRSFVKAGIPTISIGVVPEVDAHQLWLMMNAGRDTGLVPNTVPPILRTIHTADDNTSKLDEDTMRTMLRVSLGVVRAVARH
jgi:Zn-dependent M28 family amino/carboxypeptidase